MLSLYQVYAFSIFAAESGTTVAIILALVTLVGTLAANLVGWKKIRTDAKLAADQMTADDRQSNVEIAQNVLAQTVTILNSRLEDERKESNLRLKTAHEQHTNEMNILKADHARDVTRLEGKIDRIKKSHDECVARNRELDEEVRLLKNGGRDGK